jgi:hypothetical protein
VILSAAKLRDGQPDFHFARQAANNLKQPPAQEICRPLILGAVDFSN